MGDYFWIFSNEPTIPCVDSWIATQPRLGCSCCGLVDSPYAVNAEVEYVSDFSNLTTRTNRRWHPKNLIGGSIAILSRTIVDCIGEALVDKAFLIGRLSCDKKAIDSHVSLVPRYPSDAVWIRSTSPLDVIECDLCDSVLHAFNGPAYIVSAGLTEPIYAAACSGNSLIVRSDVAERLQSISVPEMVVEKIGVLPESSK